MKKTYILLFIFLSCACNKKLDLKPTTSLVMPTAVSDFENLLDNSDIMNEGIGLPQISADEYYIPSISGFQALVNPITRTAYTWSGDIFEGQTQIRDWTLPYSQIFICNSVLDALKEQDAGDDAEKKRIKGWALFGRAYAFYTLVSAYSKAYDQATSADDLGIPLKLNSSVTELVPRSSVQESYDQIIKDALESTDLLQQDIIADKRNRPSKVAAFALLARVFLSMRDYKQAEAYADKSLVLYGALSDYNTLPISARVASFNGYNSPEVIYYVQNSMYGQVTSGSGIPYAVDTALIAEYQASDLRKQVYFKTNIVGGRTNYALKGINTMNASFTGLAVDELYLIKAECLARRDMKDEALSFLNTLIKSRTVAAAFVPFTATEANVALDIILTERRKELIWRSLRWTDLKRLNLEGRNITLTRDLNGTIYRLEPNSPKYVFPIPDDEIALSGIQQNIR